MKHQRAFTLVELSIVLVILGLLIGGVLTGQSLIRAAELRSVSTQFNQYLTATQTFRDKYFALQGDMTNAQSYWGVAHATPATCATTASTTTATCNGDGNGRIEGTASGSNESFRFWQHLANAGLIEGSYNGIQQGSTGTGSTRANVPAGKISSSLWFTTYWGPLSGSLYWYNADYDNVLEFGAITANVDPITGLLKPEEAYNIDMKMDDGKPATGKVMIRCQTGLGACTDSASNTAYGANYLLTNTAATVALAFRQVF